jgi:perosamine synthetase
MIPVFEPYLGEEEVQAVADAVRAGEISGSFGENIPAFEREFADFVGAAHGVAVTSGTAALQLAVAALDLEPGSEVLVSASTNIATALAAFHNGLVAVPVDSENETWNLDLDLVESLVSERTRAIIPVHLFGHPVDMDRLNEIAARHDLVVIEDCAESHGATVRGRTTGALGHMGCFSFYANKIITTGEGGMVTTDSDALAERLRLLRNLAFQRPRFFHEHAGFNFRMTGFQAAMGRAQLRKIDLVVKQKRRVARTYNELLSGVPGIVTPAEKEWARNVYWMYSVVVTDEFPLGRDELMEALRGEGVDSRTFFCPMNLQPFLREQDGWRDIPCPVAEDLWHRGLYLPCAVTLSDEDIARIVERVQAVASARR